MNRFFLFVAVLFLIFSSCKEDVKLTIDEELLIKVIVDAHLAEAALQNLTKARKDSMATLYYNQIFQIHEVSQETFETNMNILKAHPHVAESVYEKVIDQLNKLEIDKEKKEDKKK